MVKNYKGKVCNMYQDEYKRWLAADLEDADLKPELAKVEGNDDEIKDRFAVALKFGTAGLRGVLGAGTNRMNIYVVRQATQGLANWVKTQGGNQTVAISYDSRLKSDVFAKTAAGVLAANGIKVAVVGSGPAGLAFAGDMAKRGYSVTVYEALHEIGGVLKYGIPEFRLPNAIVDTEIDGLRRLGVEFESNCIVGKTLSYDDLHAMGFKGIFVASGAGLPRFMNIPGENLNGVMSSNEFLTRVNLMGAARQDEDTPVLHGHNVAVIGGGNTAMDSVRTARRMGAENVMLVYRRSEDEMPARREEVKHAKEEGVRFLTLHNPLEYEGDEKGNVRLMRLQRMELGEPDESGRRSPVAVDGAVEDVPVDLVIVSVGVSPNPLIPNAIPELEVSRRGTIVVDESTMRSSLPDIYAGGDIVRGGATVILAMGDGRRAAAEMDKSLQNQ